MSGLQHEAKCNGHNRIAYFKQRLRAIRTHVKRQNLIYHQYNLRHILSVKDIVVSVNSP